MDGQTVNIPSPSAKVESHRTLFGMASGPLEEAVPQGRGRIRCRSPRKKSQEKPCEDDAVARTKTDTGGRDEYSKALERTLVKELCNMAP